jgi:prepilin-type N-terminal cleavage/methylation domain-containing protein
VKNLFRNQNTKTLKGFTLIELLVVIAIIGLLASVVLLALNSARAKSRDAKKLADVRQLTTALELYYNDFSGYPALATAAAVTTGGTTLSALVPSYVGALPTAPTPADTNCTAATVPTLATTVSSGATVVNGNNSYMYLTGSAGSGTPAVDSTYKLFFCIGATTGGISPAGWHFASPGGIQ